MPSTDVQKLSICHTIAASCSSPVRTPHTDIKLAGIAVRRLKKMIVRAASLKPMYLGDGCGNQSAARRFDHSELEYLLTRY